MANGEKVYSRICAACHQPAGTGLPPTFPALKGSPITTGPIPGHVDIVFNGKAGTAMQAFKGQLSDVDIASVITYERNAWGNNTNTLVQPIHIKSLRDGKTIADALATQPLPAGAKPAAAPVSPQSPAAATPTSSSPAAATPAPQTPAAPAQPATPSPAPMQPTGVPAPAATTVTSQTAPVASTADALKAAMERGEKIYMGTCAVCHQPTGSGMPPTFPALKGSKIATGPMIAHINYVLYGKQGTAMQAFKDQFDDQQIADVITYERNAWGNNTGTLVKPEDIKAGRQLDPNKQPAATAPSTPSTSNSNQGAKS